MNAGWLNWTELRSRKARTLAVTIGIVSLLAIAAIAVPAYEFTQSLAVGRHAETLAGLIEEGKLDEANQFAQWLGEHSPQALEDARVVRLLGSLHGREQTATERHAAFAAALEQVKTAGTEHPDLESLERAESLAQSETDARMC